VTARQKVPRQTTAAAQRIDARPCLGKTRFQRFLDFDAEITARQLQIAMGVALDPLARQRLGERLAGLILTGPEPRGYQRMRQDLVCRGSSREPNWA
jgi:hypothetical protein